MANLQVFTANPADLYQNSGSVGGEVIAGIGKGLIDASRHWKNAKAIERAAVKYGEMVGNPAAGEMLRELGMAELQAGGDPAASLNKVLLSSLDLIEGQMKNETSLNAMSEELRMRDFFEGRKSGFNINEIRTERELMGAQSQKEFENKKAILEMDHKLKQARAKAKAEGKDPEEVIASDEELAAMQATVNKIGRGVGRFAGHKEDLRLAPTDDKASIFARRHGFGNVIRKKRDQPEFPAPRATPVNPQGGPDDALFPKDGAAPAQSPGAEGDFTRRLNEKRAAAGLEPVHVDVNTGKVTRLGAEGDKGAKGDSSATSFTPKETTGYFPGTSAATRKAGLKPSVEGGTKDAWGNQIGHNTLEGYASGKGDYAVVAMDNTSAPFKNKSYLISEEFPGILFRVMDNGKHGNGKTGTGWVDIASDNPDLAKSLNRGDISFQVVSDEEARKLHRAFREGGKTGNRS